MTLVRRSLSALLFLALPVQLAAAPVRKPAPPAAKATDWSKVATRLPSGAFVQGNPAARVKLVEYLSLTCPHCAHFEGEAIPPLTAKYIRTGLVSYEVRHALRDPFDFAGSLLARCDGPQAFFTRLPRIFAQQIAWTSKAQSWSTLTQLESNLPPDQMLPQVADGAGFPTLLGMSADKAKACLTNHGEQQLLNAMAADAWNRPAFPGTPAFLINGALQQNIGGWADLDRKLGAALASRPTPGKTPRT